MSSTFQTSGAIDSSNSLGGGQTDPGNTNTEILEYGNPSTYTVNVTATGSKSIMSSINLSGSSTNINIDPLIKIQIPNTPGTNWNLDLEIRAFSNTSCIISDTVLVKASNDSIPVFLVSGRNYFSDPTKLMLPVVSFDQSSKIVTVKQPQASINDGPSYYVIKFSFTSGNNVNVGIPSFFL